MNETAWLAAVAGSIASAGGALFLAVRAAAPLQLDNAERIGGAGSKARLRVASQSAFVLLATAAALSAIAAVAQVTDNLTPEVGYVLPLIAAVVGLFSYTFIRSRGVVCTGTSYAALVPRSSGDFVTRRWRAAPMALAVVLTLVALASALSPAPYVPYRGVGVAVVVLLAGTVVLAARLALKRLALMPVLTSGAGALDADRRRVGGRVLVLVAAWALLATTALIGMEAGVGLWMNSTVLFHGPAVATATAFGAGLSTIGATAAFASFATALAAITATIATAVRAVRTTRTNSIAPVAVTA